MLHSHKLPQIYLKSLEDSREINCSLKMRNVKYYGFFYAALQRTKLNNDKVHRKSNSVSRNVDIQMIMVYFNSNKT